MILYRTRIHTLPVYERIFADRGLRSRLFPFLNFGYKILARESGVTSCSKNSPKTYDACVCPGINDAIFWITDINVDIGFNIAE